MKLSCLVNVLLLGSHIMMQPIPILTCSYKPYHYKLQYEQNFGSSFSISSSMFAIIPAWKWCCCMQCLQYISTFFNFLQALEQQLVQLLEQVLYLVRFVLVLNQPHALTLLWLENSSGSAQSFTLWWQETTEITHHDHYIVAPHTKR